jgi:predicted TIM-barrel fold metal-dependent hydrolase
MLIDVHIHAGEIGPHYPDWWIEELYRFWGSEHFRMDGDPHDTAGQRLVKTMDRVGIDIACVMSSDHRRVYRDRRGPYTPNDFVAEVISVDTHRLVGTCSVDPIRDPYAGVQEVRRMVERHGFRCIKIYPSYDHFYPADESCWELYRTAIELDIPVQFHMGWTPCVNAPMKYQLPHLLDEVGIRFPDLKVIVAHLGYPWVEECACLLAKHENFYADLAYWGTFPPEKILRHLNDFRVMCSFDKLLYGSENSHTRMFPEVVRGLNDVADDHGFPKIEEKDMEKLMWWNAARLLKIPVPEEDPAARAATR